LPPAALFAGPLLAGLALAIVPGCTDRGGTAPIGLQDAGSSGDDDGGGDRGPIPTIEEIVPARTVVGDTVVVVGRDFGDGQGSSLVFSTSSRSMSSEAEILSWSAAEIVAVVPPDAARGEVRVRVESRESLGRTFDVAPRVVSYAADVTPLFQVFGCVSCHGGSGGLSVLPYEALMSGNSANGPVVIPRRSGASLLLGRLLPSTPTSLRMPQGGPYLDARQILILADWIDQNARNN
jgi:hypothetical protein